MSVVISGVLLDPSGKAVSGAQITLTAIANSMQVLRGFTCSVMTAENGQYSVRLRRAIIRSAWPIRGAILSTAQ